MAKQILKQIHNKLIISKKTVAIAESCTGGELCSLLTSLPGSSNYFILGAITYSNKSKEIMLNVPAKIIAKFGAVSRQAAILMAKNIRKKTHADYSLSVTGIAGPCGATKTKPVGTIFIAFASKNKTLCRLFQLAGKRAIIRKKSVREALRLLNQHL